MKLVIFDLERALPESRLNENRNSFSKSITNEWLIKNDKAGRIIRQRRSGQTGRNTCSEAGRREGGSQAEERQTRAAG